MDVLLLLEDDRLYSQLIRDHYIARDFAVVQAYTLHEGLQLLDEFPVAVIVADLNLPDSRGSLTVVQLVLARPTTPLIVLSGYPDLEADCLRVGASAFLAKGQLQAEDLNDALHRAVARKSVQLSFAPAKEALGRAEEKLGALEKPAGR